MSEPSQGEMFIWVQWEVMHQYLICYTAYLMETDNTNAFNMHVSYAAALAVHLHNPTRCNKFPLLHFTFACAISFSADLQ